MAINLTSTPYTQDFNTLASSGSSGVLPDGWVILESGTNANQLYAAGTGSGNAGDVYSFGSNGSSERALGTLLSGSLTPTIGAAFTNATGATLTELLVSYVGEHWRLGTTGRADRLDFQYSLDATSLSNGTWVDVNALDFNSPSTTATGALDGNAATNRTAVSASIGGLSIAAGTTFWIRWSDFNASGADDGLAVDDFRVATTTQSGQTLTLSTPDASAAEVGNDPASFRLTLTTAAATALVVSYVVTGSASADDFTPALTGNVTIPAGSSSIDITITPVDDSLVEGTETLTLTLDTLSGYTISGSPASISIADNDVGATKISAVQGSGDTSPLNGQTVTIEAIVVADTQGSAGLQGFFVQEEDADTDGSALTSEGLFVFQGSGNSTAVQVGDKVRVSGTVTEFVSTGITLTELGNITSVQVMSSGNALPTAAAVQLPATTPTQLEALEGMRVKVAGTLTVTDTFDLSRFGEVLLAADGPGNEPGTDARLDQFTQFHDPSVSGLAAYTAQNALRTIVLDDGSSTQNPATHLGRDSLPLSATNTLRGGDTITNLEGVLDQRFGTYRIQPTGTVDVDAVNARTAVPDVGGTLQVASLNVLNFFNGDGLGGGFPTARGANTLAEYQRQLPKIVQAILGTGAEVVGLLELENDGYGANSAIASLVNALNAATAAGTWSFVDPGRAMGSDAIAVGMIYQSAVVTPKGAAAVLDSAVDARFDSANQRPSLAQTFEVNATGALFTPVINHLKSKGSSAGNAGDADSGDGQGFSNGTRTQAAKALVDWLATDPTHQGDTDYLVLGDLNAYAKEDPLKALEAGADDTAGTADDLSNLISDTTYSYSFDGQWGALDHALGSASLVSQVTGASKWHINADEPTALDYNTEFKTASQIDAYFAPDAFRASDHDPVVVGLNLGVTRIGTANGDALQGTSGPDTLIPGQGRDLVQGGDGADRFVFNSLLDLFDIIGDWQRGQDHLVIDGLMRAVGAAGRDPVAGGYLQVQPLLLTGTSTSPALTLVTFDPDGSAGPASPRPLVELVGTSPVTDPAELLAA